MKKAIATIVMTLFLASMLPFVIPASAEKFQELDGVVVRNPQKARVGKNFNIGIYVDDALVETNPGDGSGGDYDFAELYISVAGPGICIMWNDWFEAQGLTIGPTDDLIVAPYVWYLPGPDEILGTYDDIPVYEYSMEYDAAVSKLGDVPGWTGNVVCNANTLGAYTFTLTAKGISIATFTVTVS